MDYLPVEFPHESVGLNSKAIRELDSCIKPELIHRRLNGIPVMDSAGYRWNPATSISADREQLTVGGIPITRFTSEFWTSRQRKASPIHEVSYRACFKPQLPRFFITRLTRPGDTVYDPFSGRGTTVIEAGLLGRKVIANDSNPLSRILTYPRFFIPSEQEIRERLKEIPIDADARAGIDLSMFYHRNTEAEIISLRTYLQKQQENDTADYIDEWIRMVATNRLTGHSGGFFSVYTLPPNQALSAERQQQINLKRKQVPPYRNTKELICRKTRALIRGLTAEEKECLKRSGDSGLFLTGDSRETRSIPDESVDLTVTSPPFLDTVQYAQANWLRCWFNNIEATEIERNLTITRSLDSWCQVMGESFREFFRVLVPGGHIAFEVGEIRRGRLKLDEHIVPIGVDAGFFPLGILVNLQEFTKTSHIWGIGNNNSGTNTNRIVLFRKDG
jgi:DNA modification methylase